MRRVAVAIALLIVGAACSDGANDPAPSTAPESTAAATTVAPDTTEPAQQTTSTQATTTTTTTAPAAGFAALAETLDDAGTIAVNVEGTHRPRLSWTSDAALDRVIVLVSDADGEVLWAWGGQGEDVTVGAGAVDRDGLGAAITRPGWVQVVGYNAAGTIIAISGLEPIG